MVEGIILAAGSSSRAGCFKMELPLGDKTLLERSIEGMYDVCERIIVVGGYKIERVRDILRGYAKVDVLENADWRSGMFSSVKVGAASIRGENFFLLPADVPLVSERVYWELLNAEGETIVPAYRGVRGHPVLLRSSMKADIANASEGSCLREIIRRKGFRIVEVDDKRILLNVNTRDDYEHLFGHERYPTELMNAERMSELRWRLQKNKS